MIYWISAVSSRQCSNQKNGAAQALLALLSASVYGRKSSELHRSGWGLVAHPETKLAALTTVSLFGSQRDGVKETGSI